MSTPIGMEPFVDRFRNDMSSISAASSPDPLNASLEGVPNSAAPSSRRVTRSQTLRSSSRLSSVNPSPRKQIFSLDVGNESAPQKIRVTVEADDSERQNVSRRLFQTQTQSPTPKKPTRATRGGTITKKVPLRGETDDEGAEPAPTPRRRGRPPKGTNGTPAPSAKKRAAPIRKTPARPRRTKLSQEVTSDAVAEEDNDATPKPTTQRGTAKKRKVDNLDEQAEQTPVAKRRTRSGSASVAPSEGSLSSQGGYAPFAPSDHGDDDNEEDIWMATLSDPPARFSRRKSPIPTQEEELAMIEQGQQPERSTSNAEGRPETEDAMSEVHTSRAATEDIGSEVHAGYAGPDDHDDYPTSDAHDRSGEKDTIMIQEEFTMISVGSLPSMQAGGLNMSVQSNYQDMGDETGLIINGALEELRQSLNRNNDGIEDAEEEDDEVSFVGEQTSPAQEDAATPRQNLPPAPGQQTSPLAEKTPTPRNNLLSVPSPTPSLGKSPRRGKKTEDLGRQLALKSLRKEQSPLPSAKLKVAEQSVEEPSAYDDSFSEIPEAVLEAATPKPLRRYPIEEQEEAEIEPDEAVQMSIERQSRASSPHYDEVDPKSLIAPDETPSPAMSDGQSGDGAAQSTSKASERTIMEDMASSPPLLNFSQREETNAVRRSRQLSDTPAVQAATSQAPPKVGDRDKQGISLPPPEPVGRQSFSPIVRAGRALQRITSDPPSPPVGDSALGSPFRTSSSKSPTAITQPKVTQQVVSQDVERQATVATHQSPVVEQQEERHNSPWSSAFAPFKQIKNVVAQAAQRFSPRPAPAPARATAPAPPPPTDNMSDPFLAIADEAPRRSFQRPAAQPAFVQAPPASHPTDEMSDPFVAEPKPSRKANWERQDTLSMHNSMFSLGNGGAADVDIDRFASKSSSVEAEVDVDDEMSWVADGAPVQIRDEQEAAISDTLRAQRGSPEPNGMPYMDVDMQSVEEQQEVEDPQQEPQQDDFDDADLWDFEASRPTPGRPEPRPATTQQNVLNPPRRSKLPNSWRQNSKRLVYNDERRRAAENMISREAEDDEFDLLSHFGGATSTHQKEKQVDQAPSQPSARKGGDLSSFFSSPALLPDVRPPFELGSNRPLKRPVAPAQDEEEQPRPTKRNLFSFGNRSRGRPLESNATSSRPLIPQKSLEIGAHQPRRDLFSPIKRFEVPDSAMSQESSFELPAARPQALPPIPQKANFAPRLKAANKTLFGPNRPTTSLFSKPTVGFADPRSDARQTTPEQQTSPGESSFVAPELKPLPPPQQSPTKSSFRSPLKPKTPGRVVVFASSTLSPLAQAQARAERRRSRSASPEKSSAAPPTRPVDFDKENQSRPNNNGKDMSKGGFNSIRTSITANADNESAAVTKPKTTSSLFSKAIPNLAPPATKPPPPVHLSPTTWTKAHWERLDALVQQRRRTGALNFQLAHPLPKIRNRDQRNRSGRLVGRQVVAQGETMTLEQWHLDVVDAFAAELGGYPGVGGEGCVWDEKVLAKRVFALLVGEERRRAAKADRLRAREEVRV
ncbi:hypothetical protein DL546_005114 [Coniochaeta pulveracea]|uniref:Uncharacterized protein n=1 Tax=Coniochaeta pulveracea TaxID=177199 RepID=A0A420YHH9_9PEZI|nr:hypothetical protein DL546_005114 [Coniochaeta pulveracea]